MKHPKKFHLHSFSLCPDFIGHHTQNRDWHISCTLYYRYIPLYINREESGKKMNKKINKIIISLSLLIIPIFIIGCAQSQKSDIVYYRPTVSPKMILYSAGETTLDPQIFAYRSDWPATEGNAQIGQMIYYREYWYDRQSLYPNHNDSSYKLFQGYRFGKELR